MEQSQTAGESSARQRDEVQREMERLRLAQRDAERTLAARERAHRQRTKGLEEQVTHPPAGPRTPLLLLGYTGGDGLPAQDAVPEELF